MNTPNWQASLTAMERKHLKQDAGITSLEQAKMTFEFQRRPENLNHNGMPICSECHRISKKLGL